MVSKTVVSIFILGAALKVLKKYKSKKNKRIIKNKDTSSLDKLNFKKQYYILFIFSLLAYTNWYLDNID